MKRPSHLQGGIRTRVCVFVRQMMHEDWRRLNHEVLVRVYYKEDGQTGHGNSECEYSSWMDNPDVLTVKNHRAHRACHQNPRHLALQLFIHRYKCRRTVSSKCTNARTAPVSKETTTKSARRRTTLPTPRLRRLSHLLQMSDMLALREHLSPVKKEEHTVRNYSTA